MSRSRRAENTGFACVHCSAPVPANTDGHYRNHCPHCLWSLHVDELPGDRASDCQAPNGRDISVEVVGIEPFVP